MLRAAQARAPSQGWQPLLMGTPASAHPSADRSVILLPIEPGLVCPARSSRSKRCACEVGSGPERGAIGQRLSVPPTASMRARDRAVLVASAGHRSPSLSWRPWQLRLEARATRALAHPLAPLRLWWASPPNRVAFLRQPWPPAGPISAESPPYAGAPSARRALAPGEKPKRGRASSEPPAALPPLPPNHNPSRERSCWSWGWAASCG